MILIAQRTTAVLLVLATVPITALAQARTANADEAGEAQFRAIYFLEGPLVSQVPELKRLKAQESRRQLNRTHRAALNKYRDGLIAAIRKDSPKAFSEFAADLRSGDRAAVSKRLESTSAQIKKLVEANEDLARSAKSVPGGSDGTAEVIVIDTYTYTFPFTAVQIASQGGALTAESREQQKLFQDRLVASLVASLKSGP